VSDAISLAGRGRRLLATLIDMVLVPPLALVLVAVFGVIEDAEDFRDLTWIAEVIALAVVAYLLLNGYLLWARGQTVGKALLGIRIVTAGTGALAPFWKLVVLRAPFFPFLFLLPVWPITVVPLVDQAMIFGRQRRCLHDLIAGTSVRLATRKPADD
jgi:uncharacterized RDD family membrane protein YckC